MPLQPSSRDDFEVALICALPIEYDAVALIFDELWDEDGDPYGRAAGDTNNYTTGCVGKYNVVLALLPHMGKVNAASAVASMRSSYSSLRLALLIGVCGAVPHIENDEILLGDVIISKTVVQYDLGRQYPDRFIRKDTIGDSLGRPTKDIRSLLVTFETDLGMERLKQRTANVLKQIQTKSGGRRPPKYNYPGTAEDKLFAPTYRHKHHASPACICRYCVEEADPVCDEALGSSCVVLGCDERHLVARDRLARQQLEGGSDALQRPAIHVGAIASGDTVMKSAAHRDQVAHTTNVIAFEMEGAGIWDEVPCIVVKGVCDYADSHKHKGWQNFAAATAASASKAILASYTQTDKARVSASSERLPAES